MHNPIKHMTTREFSAARDQVASTAFMGLLLIFLAGAVSFAGVAGVRHVMRADPPPVVTPACGDARVEQLASAVEACIEKHSNPRKRTGCIAVVQRALCTEPATSEADAVLRAELDLVKADLIEVMKVARRPMWRRHPDGHFPLE